MDLAAYDGKPTGEPRVLLRPALAPRTETDAFGRTRLVRPIPHDFRRTAVRRLVRAGVSEHIAMELVGHRTRSMLERYDMVNESDVREAIAKVATKLGSTATTAVSLTVRRRA